MGIFSLRNRRRFWDRVEIRGEDECLFLGTQLENMKDMARKRRGRSSRGEKKNTNALTEEQVREIRHLHATGLYTYKALGEMFGVTNCTIFDIVKGRSWIWLV